MPFDFGEQVDGPGGLDEKTKASIIAEGVKAYQERINAIIGSPKAKGKTDYAMKVASKHPNMSVDDVLEIVEGYNVPGAKTAQEEIESRTAETNVNEVKAQPGKGPNGEPSGDDVKMTENWKVIADRVNAERGYGLKA